MVVTTVVVRQIRPHLIRVEWPTGYQLVAGGRLVVETGCKKDMPEYTPEMFPVPFNEWQDGEHPEVDVIVVDRGGKLAGPVAAQNHLFTVHAKDEIKAWLNEVAAKKEEA